MDGLARHYRGLESTAASALVEAAVASPRQLGFFDYLQVAEIHLKETTPAEKQINADACKKFHGMGVRESCLTPG
jgi:hypothetical protein